MNDEIWLVFGLYLFAAVVALLVLYFVIRAAILSALDEDRRRVERATRRPAAVTHLDQDGL